MVDKHAYVSVPGAVVQTVNQLRKTFPGQVSAETLKKLSIAPNNESYVINVLRFAGVIDETGKKTPAAESVFKKHQDADFQKGFGEMVKGAYADLFSLHGDDAWAQDLDRLISYFREADGTSDVVGQRQAKTFQALASLAGHGDLPTARAGATRRAAGPATAKAKTATRTAGPIPIPGTTATSGDVGLTVRIEINLPVAPDQATYDRIFKSIRENLLGGK